MRSTCGNTHMCESTYIFYDESRKNYSKSRNCIVDETLDDSLWHAAINTGIAKLKES